MSEIIGIYSNLAALSVTFTSNAGDTVTVTCKDLDELRLNIDSAYCPIRQLLPIGNETEGQIAQLTFGRSQELTPTVSSMTLRPPAVVIQPRPRSSM
jgi:hypothetical protein